MGLAFLPWERLPAYALGPLLCFVSICLLVTADERSFELWTVATCCVVFGAWIIWRRYKTGEEPLWSEEQRAAARERDKSHEK